jgi:hypothetical protein
MDHKKFIQSHLFETNINKIINNENRLHRSSINDHLSNCFLLDDLDFINYSNIENIKNDFTKISEKLNNNNIVLSGPSTRYIFDQSENKNEYFVSYITNTKSMDDNNNDNKNDNKNDNNNINLIDKDIIIDGKKFIIKKKYNFPCLALIDHSNIIDRIMFYNNNIYVSLSFLITIFNKTSNIDFDSIDPIFKTTPDIYEVRKNIIDHEKNIKILIDEYDTKTIEKLDHDNFINYINYNSVLLLPIEYVILKLKQESNNILIHHLRMIITIMKNKIGENVLLRSPKIIGKIFDIHNYYPALFDELQFNSIINDFSKSKDLTLNNLNYNTIEEIIKIDRDDLFIEYLSKCNLILKFKSNNSKSLVKIIDSIILYKPKNIINKMIKLNVISNYYKHKIIFLSEQFEFFDQNLLNNLIFNNNVNDNVNINENENDNISENDKVSENMKDSNDDDDNNNKYLSLEFIKEFFPEIIKRSLVRSYYIITKLFPNILTEYKDLLFEIDSYDILKLICEYNHDILNYKINNKTLLMNLSEKGYDNMIILLLDNCDNILDVDNQGNNFIHYLVRYNHISILSKICRRVNDIIDIQNDDMESPLLLASKLGYEEIFLILKGMNSNLNLVDEYGNTCYHYICSNKLCLNMVIPLIKNNFGYTPKDYCKISKEYYYFIDEPK